MYLYRYVYKTAFWYILIEIISIDKWGHIQVIIYKYIKPFSKNEIKKFIPVQRMQIKRVGIATASSLHNITGTECSNI